MQEAKKLIGKAIMHQDTGQQIAIVHDVLLNDSATAILAVLVGGGWLRGTRVVPWSAVVHVHDVVLVGGEDPIIDARSDPQIAHALQQPQPLTGTTLLTDRGEQIGTVGDLLIDDHGHVLGYQVTQGFITNLGDHTFLPIAYVEAVGTDAVIAKAMERVSRTELEQTDQREHG
jgi:uncharacterized protein YrrD